MSPFRQNCSGQRAVLNCVRLYRTSCSTIVLLSDLRLNKIVIAFVCECLGYRVCLLVPSLWVKHAVVTLLSSSHHFLDVKSEKPNGIKGSSTFIYGASCPFSYVSPWFVPDCFLGHP